MGFSTMAVNNKQADKFKRTGSMETCRACKQTHAVTIKTHKITGTSKFRCPNCGLPQEP